MFFDRSIPIGIRKKFNKKIRKGKEESMKKGLSKGLLVAIVILVVVATAIAQVKPDWVTKSPGWVEGEFVFGVGKAPKMNNFSLQRSTAEGWARAAILKVMDLKIATLRGSQIVEVWQDVDGTIYALARVPKSGIMPEN
jgi:hypothetical protein